MSEKPLICSYDDLWWHVGQQMPDVDDTAREAVITQLLETGYFAGAEPPESDHLAVNRALLGSGKYYAIQASDLAPLKVGWMAVVALSLLQWVATPAGAVALAGFAGTVAVYRRKRIELGEREATVLLALRRYRDAGLASAEIKAYTTFPMPDVEEALKRLGSCRKRDNTLANLVRCDDGRWYAVDV